MVDRHNPKKLLSSLAFPLCQVRVDTGGGLIVTTGYDVTVGQTHAARMGVPRIVTPFRLCIVWVVCPQATAPAWAILLRPFRARWN
jgi:hypothetical protein